MTRHLKALETHFSLHGTQFGIPMCCIIWFTCVWNTLRADNDFNDWYGNEFQGYDTIRLEGGKDRIMCPECVVKALVKQPTIEAVK